MIRNVLNFAMHFQRMQHLQVRIRVPQQSLCGNAMETVMLDVEACIGKKARGETKALLTTCLHVNDESMGVSRRVSKSVDWSWEAEEGEEWSIRDDPQ